MSLYGYLHLLQNFYLQIQDTDELQQDYIHKVPVILHDNLQRESHKTYGTPTSVT
jgi:hypothetical protein